MIDSRYFSLKDDVKCHMATGPAKLANYGGITFIPSYKDVVIPKGTIVSITQYTREVDPHMYYIADMDAISYITKITFYNIKDDLKCSTQFRGEFDELFNPVDPKTVKVLFGQ